MKHSWNKDSHINVDVNSDILNFEINANMISLEEGKECAIETDPYSIANITLKDI